MRATTASSLPATGACALVRPGIAAHSTSSTMKIPVETVRCVMRRVLLLPRSGFRGYKGWILEKLSSILEESAESQTVNHVIGHSPCQPGPTRQPLLVACFLARGQARSLVRTPGILGPN